jgi:iron complex outermembrane recepter protein
LLRHLHNRSDYYRLERQLPGGVRTHWKSAPFCGPFAIRFRSNFLSNVAYLIDNGRHIHRSSFSVPNGRQRAAALALGGVVMANGSNLTWCKIARCAIVAIALHAAIASATSDAPSNAGAVDSDAQIQEIVVTAQRRAENLQNVPISAQVVSAQELSRQNINSLHDLSAAVPAVHIGTSARADDFFIRGIGSGENQSFDQSVGTFIDDIYHGRSRTSAATFLDLDRVEILKGPQSTFFGNNAIAGALNIVTQKPSESFDASARALYGTFGQYDVEAALSLPINDRLAIRFAATANGMRGWLKNDPSGDDQPDDNNVAGRATLLFRPTEDFDAMLKVEGSKNRNDGALPLQLVNCPPPAPFTAGGFCNVAQGLGVPTGINNNHNAESPGQGIQLNTAEDVLTANYRRWGHTFTSVTGFYDYRYSMNLDPDGTPLTLFHAQLPEHYHQFSEELRVASPTDQPIQYLGGLYLQTDDLDISQDFDFAFLSPTIQSIPPFAALVPYLPLGQGTDYSQIEHSYAVFGSVSWNLTDQFRLSAGLRGSWVNKSYNRDVFYAKATESFGGLVPLPPSLDPLAGALGLGAPGELSGSRSDKAWMPSAKLQYQFYPAVMAYLSYARGFKAGGFNGGDTTGVAANIPFEPEHVNAYEVGLKSEWWDRRVLVNLAVFRADYTNLQVASNLVTGTGTVISVVKNAATSVSQGVELEGQWALSPHFRLRSNATYLEAYYKNYPNVSPTSPQQLAGITIQDLSGQPTAFAPRWSGTLAGDYTAHLPGDYQLVAEVSETASSHYFLTGNGNDDPLQTQGMYAKTDARLSFESPGGRWAIDLIGKNLTDRSILLFAANQPTALGSLLVQKETPRNAAIQFRYHW